MSAATVVAMADQLRRYATHFEFRDWDYTRETNIRHIRLRGDWSDYDHPVRRLLRTLRRFVGRDRIEREVFGAKYPFAWRHPIITLRSGLSTSRNLPDGVLDGGGVIVQWEEIGEYLQYVQPTVGALLANLMDAHPELPEVQAVAVEMKRINDRYGERLKDEAAS